MKWIAKKDFFMVKKGDVFSNNVTSQPDNLFAIDPESHYYLNAITDIHHIDDEFFEPEQTHIDSTFQNPFVYVQNFQ
jgi:hypothetical protein